MKLYAIRNYDDGTATGYLIGNQGPVIFQRLTDAMKEADRLNAMPHAPGRVYRAEAIKD